MIVTETWLQFKNIEHNFLFHYKPSDYKNMVTTLLHNCQNLGLNISIKLHSLDLDVAAFRENLGCFSKEY